jgi:hypothetical protein
MPEKKTSNAVPAAPKEQPQQINPAPAPVELKQPRRAKPNSFKRSEMVEVRFTHYLEADDTFEDCLRPDFWTTVSDRIMAMSHLTAINKFHGWEAEFRIINVANKLVKLVPLRLTKWETQVTDSDVERLKSNYRKETRADGWRVIDDNGNQLISGLGSEKEAQAFIDQLVKNVAA